MDIFLEIRPSPAKFLAGFVKFGTCQCSCTVPVIMDKTNAAELSSDIFTILVSVTKDGKIQNRLPF